MGGPTVPQEPVAVLQKERLEVAEHELHCLDRICAEDRLDPLIADADELHRTICVPVLLPGHANAQLDYLPGLSLQMEPACRDDTT